MIPYVVFSLIGHLVKCVKMLMEGDTNWVHYVLSPIKQIMLSGSLDGNLPLWFLPSLLAVQLIYTVLHEKLNDRWIVSIGLTIAFLLYYLNIQKPLYLGNITIGLAVFGFGHLMRQPQYETAIFALAGIAYMTILLTVQGTLDFRINMPHNGNYLIVVLFALSGCVVINNIFKRMSFSLKLFEWIGKRSMNFYVTHWLVLLTCSIVFPYTGWTMFGVMTVACMMMLPVLDRMILTPRMNSNTKEKG